MRKTDMQSADLLFRIFAQEREYRIYTNGQVEGFGEHVKVINYFPRLCSDLLQEASAPKHSEEGTPPPHSESEVLETAVPLPA
jgi:hypothetical protein